MFLSMITPPALKRTVAHQQGITCKLLGFFWGLQVEQFIQSPSKLSSPKSISNVRQRGTYRERIDRSSKEVNRRQPKLIISLKKFFEKKKMERSFSVASPLWTMPSGGGSRVGVVRDARHISRGIEVGGGWNIRHPIRHVINPVRSLMELNLQLQ
ncbi:hypothetical protein CEXT_620511 [Caerostris extrusa]|uniref:Uncharacterized protein n=1 Tax=Caerostris extrusa TaxID=172846 RepID=A0AAV4QPU6_CAEEX|nr:hypothetical protein CEXT_620511 [Caerostris extrusa]